MIFIFIFNENMHVTFMNLVAHNWSLATEFFYRELWNLWLLMVEIQVEKMLIPNWKSMELE